MKKIILGLVAVTLSLTLAGCGKSASSKFVGTWQNPAGDALVIVSDNGGSRYSVDMVNNYSNQSPIDSGFMPAKILDNGVLEAADMSSFPDMRIENGKLVGGSRQYSRIDTSTDKGDQIKTAWQKAFNDAQAMRKARYRQ